jgi:tetratricopeptide (TPR) repeat protein
LTNLHVSNMKFTISYLIFICCTLHAYSNSFPDSICTEYRSRASQHEKHQFLTDYLQTELYFDKKGLEKGIELATEFKKLNEENAVDFVTILIALKMAQDEGNYTAGLNMALPILARFEKNNDVIGVTYALAGIAVCYGNSKDYEKAIDYLKRAIPLTQTRNDQKFLARLYNDIGFYYSRISLPDSGLIYSYKSLELATKLNYVQGMPHVLSTLAGNHVVNKDYDLALPFLRQALHHANKHSFSRALGFLQNDIAEIFLETKLYDSAFHYLQRALQIYETLDGKPQQLRSFNYLTQCFEETNQPDSANKYFRLAMTLKDTLYNLEKIKLVHSMSFTEQLRQQEIEEAKLKMQSDRKHNIQFGLIAIGIITFIILFLILSRSVITNTRMITFLSILGLLVVFEFLNLLLHPFLERITHHSPLLMLIALVSIAALLIPLHHKLEKWATQKLIEKNKSVRLANAKKTISELEKKASSGH